MQHLKNTSGLFPIKSEDVELAKISGSQLPESGQQWSSQKRCSEKSKPPTREQSMKRNYKHFHFLMHHYFTAFFNTCLKRLHSTLYIINTLIHLKC